jgi:UDP-glucuronate 4-epimerase
MNILVTGCAGFIGYHLSEALLGQGHKVLGVDNLNDYYDPALKQARLQRLQANATFSFCNFNLADDALLHGLPGAERVFHLAAQAGVRYSIENPSIYFESNILGTFNLLQWCLRTKPSHVLLASSSSVYGENNAAPFKENGSFDRPESFYAATKASTELMAHAQARIHGLPITALRFFTVYGPWGRPDMALFKFTKAILAGEPIQVYGQGLLSRDFTYVDDVVQAILLLADLPPAPQPAPYRVVNVGNHNPATVNQLIEAVEAACHKKALRQDLPMQPGDVTQTCADVSLLQNLTGFTPHTDLRHGVTEFVCWYRGYYGC